MSITEVENARTESAKGGLDISDLDFSPLFQELAPAGGFVAWLPWINLAINICLLVILLFK